MIKASDYYKEKFELASKAYSKLKKERRWVGLIRLIVFVLTASLVYNFYQNTVVWSLSLIIGLSVFLFLVRKHVDQKKGLISLLNRMELLKNYQSLLDGDSSFQNDGRKWEPQVHAYSNDLDLFGQGSFFQLLNTTVTPQGEHVLASKLLSNDIVEIQEKQNFIKELAGLSDFRLEFSTQAKGREVSVEKIEQTYKFLEDYQDSGLKISSMVVHLFSTVSVGLLLGVSFFSLPFVLLLIWGIIGLVLTGVYFKRTNDFSSITDDLLPVLQGQANLLDYAQKVTFHTLHGKNLQSLFQLDRLNPGAVIGQFSRIISRLDQRNNMMIGVLANALLLWDIRQMNAVNKWLDSYRSLWGNWRRSLAELDASKALADFVFHHPDYSFASLTADRGQVVARGLGHPLIDQEHLVKNDMELKRGNLWVVTGANMAGKSTFLRSLGLSVMMSNMGLPVCASEFEYHPVRLISSMRTSDSLMEQSSYFHAELYRLKYVLNHALEQEYLVLLDEILKGTNSIDKAEGSFRYLRKLHRGPSSIVVATHDLSLCDLANDSQTVSNYFFEADIKADELSFDYKLQHGICKNMNASYLLKKMDLID